jgi:hypothetical protein
VPDRYYRSHDTRPVSFPVGSGLAFVAAVMMIVGAWGPWISGTFFGSRDGVDLGGDGWLVFAAAALAVVPLALPLPRSALKGVWVAGFATVAAFVCWTHYLEAHTDGINVVWGLELSAVGSVLLVFAGLRVLMAPA